jgi:SAM-dependent methyltransferase
MTTFDPIKYKETTRQQWQDAAEAWHRWSPAIEAWLGPATRRMLDLAGVRPGDRVLDVAAGAGEPTCTIAERVGPRGHVLATDISSRILEHAAAEAARRGLSQVATRVLDGENLDLPEASFDVAVSRVGLIYFPDQQRALSGMIRALKPGGRVAAIVYSTPDKNGFFSQPVSVIRRRANLGPPLPGQPGPFSLGAPGAVEGAFRQAGLKDIVVEAVSSPVRLPSAAECLRFEQESFGALHQMLSGLEEPARKDAWQEVGAVLSAYEGPEGFVGPCEMLVAVGTK